MNDYNELYTKVNTFVTNNINLVITIIAIIIIIIVYHVYSKKRLVLHGLFSACDTFLLSGELFQYTLKFHDNNQLSLILITANMDIELMDMSYKLTNVKYKNDKKEPHYICDIEIIFETTPSDELIDVFPVKQKLFYYPNRKKLCLISNDTATFLGFKNYEMEDTDKLWPSTIADKNDSNEYFIDEDINVEDVRKELKNVVSPSTANQKILDKHMDADINIGDNV